MRTRRLVNLVGALGILLLATGLFLLSVPWALIVLGGLAIAGASLGATRL